MSIVADALQPHLARGFFELRGRILTTLDDVIGRKGAYRPSFDAASNVWEFDFQQQGTICEFLAHECDRFGTAAFQSYHDVAPALLQQNLIPWALVRAYYAAFYAGHSLLRALGASCSYIDGPRVVVLRNVLGLYNLSNKFSAGLYATDMNRGGTALQLRNLGQGQGGTHEAFWKLFVARVRLLEDAVLKGNLPPTDAQQVAVTLGRLRAVLTQAGLEGNWLSTIRNAIQYRQAMDVWFPSCRVNARERAALSRVAASWRSDPLAVELPTGVSAALPAFLAACSFLVSCCRTVLVRLMERGSSGRQQSFACHGPLRYLTTHRLIADLPAIA